MTRPATAAVPIHYPSSDGKPMAENDAHARRGAPGLEPDVYGRSRFPVD